MQTARLGVPIGMQIALEAWAFSIATIMAGWLVAAFVFGYGLVGVWGALALASRSWPSP